MFSSVLFWKIILGVVWGGIFFNYPQGCLTITIPHFSSPTKKPHNYFPFLSTTQLLFASLNLSGISLEWHHRVHDLSVWFLSLANLAGSTSL